MENPVLSEKAFTIDEKYMKEIEELVKEYEKDNNNMGEIKNVKHEIDLKEEPKIKFLNYTIPLKIKNEARNLIEELLIKDIIFISNSNIVSPSFIITKKNGKDLRLIIDFRELNRCTKINKFPIPKIDNCLSELKGSKVFSQIDLKNGYYQIKVKSSDQHKTAFSFDNQIYAFKRMPFGLVNAPMTFQRCMTNILGHLPFVKIYLDDILIHSENAEQHYVQLKKVFNILRTNKVQINMNKSKFLTDEVVYLGHRINKHGIRADIDRIKLFKKPVIKNKKDIQKFIGMLNWFRTYIPNFAEKMKNIYTKLSQKDKIQWLDSDQNTIDKIISEILKNTLLNFPDPNKPYTLYTDASDKALGATLCQEGKAIGFYSYLLKGSEINYNTIEKETLAIVKAAMYFKKHYFQFESYNKN